VSARALSHTSRLAAALVLALFVLLPRRAAAQESRVRDLTVMDGSVPVRLVGYGLVVGLSGTGDRAAGGVSSRHTVQSVANLLRRFGVEVPPEFLRTRNVAAVLVTAELSPFLHPGGRFDVHVASVGDARSLKGGVLWMTPLVADVGGPSLGSAQGPLLLGDNSRDRWDVNEGSARIPGGGVLEAELPHTSFARITRLALREPDLETATRIAAVINDSLGGKVARVEDPGSVLLALEADADKRAAQLARLGELKVRPSRPAMLVIDTHDGTVVAGGELTVGEATVTHGGVTLTISAEPAPAAPVVSDTTPGASAPAAPMTDVRVRSGASVQEVASALHALRTPASDVAGIFEALRALGAISAQVVIR
jgi:flagellar P-ring protein precursor FlgI